MRPHIGVSCSTLVLMDMRGVPRFALSEFYVRCVLAAGGLPVLLPSIESEIAAEHLERLDGLVLSGGWDIDPEHFGEQPHPRLGEVDTFRDDYEVALSRAAHARRLPVLAICRGIQVMNVALGGSLVQDIPSQVPGAVKHEQKTVRQTALCHSIEIAENTRLRSIVGAPQARVNSFHHQSVGRVAEGFIVSATAPDGVIEGIEDPEQPYCVGVQWHPERRGDDPITQGLFQGLVEAAVRNKALIGR